MQPLLSASTCTPPNLVAAVRAHRHAQRQVGHGFLGLPRPKLMAKLQSPARWREGERSRRVCGVCTEPCSPPRVAACWVKHGNEDASTGPRVHHAAAVRLHEGKCFCATHATATSNRSMHASLRGRALQCGCCWNVPHGVLRRCAARGCTSVATAVASACGGAKRAGVSDD